MLDELAAAWRAWLPCLVLLLGLGIYQRRLSSGRLLLLTIVSLVAFGGWVAEREHTRETIIWATWDARRVALKEALIVDGLRLPAGTVVRWNSEDPDHVVTAKLSGWQEVAPGVVLRGEIDNLYGSGWRGILAQDTNMRGWPCRAGKVALDKDGRLCWCLVAATVVPAGNIPEGTAVGLSESSDGALINLVGGGMVLSPFDVAAYSGEWLSLYADGEIASSPGQLDVRGVALSEDVIWRHGKDDPTGTDWQPQGPLSSWSGKLARPLTCEEGRVLEVGWPVTVPVNGNLVRVNHWSSDSHSYLHDSLHCYLGGPDQVRRITQQELSGFGPK